MRNIFRREKRKTEGKDQLFVDCCSSNEFSQKRYWNFRQSSDPLVLLMLYGVVQLSLARGIIVLVRHSSKTILLLSCSSFAFFLFSFVVINSVRNEIEFFNNIIHFYYYATIFTNKSSTSISSFLHFHSTAWDAGTETSSEIKGRMNSNE